MSATKEYIKSEMDKRIDDFREKSKARGLILSELDDTYLRMGMVYGIAIAGLALANIDLHDLV